MNSAYVTVTWMDAKGRGRVEQTRDASKVERILRRESRAGRSVRVERSGEPVGGTFVSDAGGLAWWLEPAALTTAAAQ
jgi:hypothetical protein